jgi:hypothetical protein
MEGSTMNGKVNRIDGYSRRECHGARMTAIALEQFVHLVPKKERPYFQAIINYILQNTLQWVQDYGYSTEFRFRNHKRDKKKRLLSCEAFIEYPPPLREASPKQDASMCINRRGDYCHSITNIMDGMIMLCPYTNGEDCKEFK